MLETERARYNEAVTNSANEINLREEVNKRQSAVIETLRDDLRNAKRVLHNPRLKKRA
jgi:hypothetical protein